MKLSLVTRADKNIEYYTYLTHPLIKKYADFCKADFIILDHEPPQLSEDGFPHFRILKVQELLNEYDRVLSLDSDLVVNNNVPNIFNVVPFDCIGSVREDIGRPDKIEKIMAIQKKFKDIGWREWYINTGCFVVSNIHKPIFDTIEGKLWDGECSDDIHIGYNIHNNGFKLFELDYKWNHMGYHGGDPIKSYFIHFAGGNKLERINNFLERIK
jgi:lipopolysaccharide biosynthesis glycosyltransferase